jgi:hypothetical protein
VGGARRPTRHDLVAFGYLLFYGEVQVRERLEEHGGEALDAVYADHVLGDAGIVEDVVWGVDFVEHVEVAGVPALFEGPSHQGLVLVR